MLKEIEKRRSIRQYLNKPIEKEKLKEVLHAGMCAPSARNTQSTRYMIVTNRKAQEINILWHRAFFKSLGTSHIQ